MSRPDDFGNVDLGADPLDSGIDLGVVAPDGGSVDLGTDLGPSAACTSNADCLDSGTPCIPSACNEATGVCEGVLQPEGVQCFPTESGPNCGGACTAAGLCGGTFGCSGACECVLVAGAGAFGCQSISDPILFCAIK